MSDTWFVRKGGGTVIGPFTSLQIRQMADTGKIDEHTPVAKEKEGPFATAGRVKGLIVHHGISPDVGDTDRRHESLPDALQPRAAAEAPAEAPAGTRDHPLLALWTLAISAGMLTGMVIYGVAWKFSGPVWVYGAALVPLAVTLFLVGGYSYLQRRTRLNRNALLVNAAFVALTVVAGAVTIYDMWTLDARVKGMQERTRRTFERADSALQ